MANSGGPSSGTLAAEPEPIDLEWSSTALLIIDMQRDFMEYAAASRIIADVSGILDHPLSRMMTTGYRHCEEPTGRANARPMTGSATKQSILPAQGKKAGLLRFARNDVETYLRDLAARFRASFGL